MKSPQFKPRCQPPDKSLVLAGRLAVQQKMGLGITTAQDWCAEQVHTTRRVWQQWESGDRRMHPAFWDLFSIKAACISDSP